MDDVDIHMALLSAYDEEMMNGEYVFITFEASLGKHSLIRAGAWCMPSFRDLGIYITLVMSFKSHHNLSFDQNYLKTSHYMQYACVLF